MTLTKLRERLSGAIREGLEEQPLRMYYVHAFAADGEQVDAFVQARTLAQAADLFAADFGRWGAGLEPGTSIYVRLVPRIDTSRGPGPLSWLRLTYAVVPYEVNPYHGVGK